jgi:hypothetical protein
VCFPAEGESAETYLLIKNDAEEQTESIQAAVALNGPGGLELIRQVVFAHGLQVKGEQLLMVA